MALGRRVLLTVASGSLIYSGMVSALGMGEISLQSALNQPLRAEIDLLDVGDLSADDIRIVLASSSDFARVGVERPAFLQDLRFTPVIEGNRSRIRVSSSQPVREPYLNFLVEITRANSRLLREYTVLLDPLPGTLEVASNRQAEIEQASALPVAAQPARFAPQAATPQASQGRRHRVASGESLWIIAAAYTDGGPSQSQFMRDVLALNSDAFAGGDPARLKAGVNLLLPDTAEGVAAVAIEPVQVDPVAESTVQERPAPDPEPADPALVDDQVALLRRQLFEELAASREENRQLKQMLIDIRVQLESVTAQLIEQNRTQAIAPPADAPTQQQTATTGSSMTPADQPAIVLSGTETSSSSSWRDWMLPGGGVLASLMLGGLWLGWRKKLRPTPPETVSLAEVRPGVTFVSSTPAMEMPRQPAHASVSETDVLEAADIYLTYGRRDEALDVLQRGIERSPAQLDIRLRQLGLIAESGDVGRYCAAAEDYLQAGGDQAQLGQLLALHPALAAAVTPADRASASALDDQDVTFVLSEDTTAVSPGSALAAAVQRRTVEAEPTCSVDSQPWLDGFDDDTLTLDELPSLLDDADSFGSMRSADELRKLEANPEHLVRLNQAVAYIKQGDMDSACIILESLATEGDDQQRQQVNELLAQIA